MRIDAVTLYRVPMELVVPHRTTQYQVATLEHVLVRVEGDGAVGWGECTAPPAPYYLGETVATSWHMLEDFLVPAILGRDWESVDELTSAWARVKANTFPKAALESAAWDLLARARGERLASMLGATRSTVCAGITLGAERDVAHLLDEVGRALSDGFTRIKLKIGPGHDVDVLAAVREKYPEAPIMVDANSAYSAKDIAHLAQLDAFGLMMIEQPFGPSELLEHRDLQRKLRTPVCLDESIRSFEDARLALDLEACRVLCLKVGSVGGLGVARRIHDLCRARGVPVWCGGMLEYGIGRATNVALAGLDGFTIAGDVAGSARYFVDDIVDPPIESVHGSTAVPAGAGFGHVVREQAIEAKSTMRRALTRSHGTALLSKP